MRLAARHAYHNTERIPARFAKAPTRFLRSCAKLSYEAPRLEPLDQFRFCAELALELTGARLGLRISALSAASCLNGTVP